MISAKRKAVPDSGNVQPAKKYKPAIPTTKTSALKDEENFPRGGASLLTSLEYKQIRIQATEDALFEQTTGTKSARNDYGDEVNEEFSQEEIVEAPAKANRKRLSKGKSEASIRDAKESGVRIEGLSYRVCVYVQ